MFLTVNAYSSSAACCVVVTPIYKRVTLGQDYVKFSWQQAGPFKGKFNADSMQFSAHWLYETQ
jgi:hypothetical protein